MASVSTEAFLIKWETAALQLVLKVNEHGCVHFGSLSPPGMLAAEKVASKDLPLTAIRFVGDGHSGNKTAKSLVGSYASERLQYKSHEIQKSDLSEELIVLSHDPVTNAAVTNHFVAYGDIPMLQMFVEVQNQSETEALIVTQLSSCTFAGLTRDFSSTKWYDDYKLLTATNGWFREAQWREQSLTDLGIDDDGILQLDEGHSASQASYGLSNRGSFSTGSCLPMGLLKHKDDLDTWFWQIEHNGSWRWEIGDFEDSIYLAIGGPTGFDHSWRVELQPQESFRSVSVSCGRVAGGIDETFGVITRYRRAIKRPHPDNESLPIIFNDYMNCLMGDPDEEKIKALLGPVVASGAQYLVIDAGWYADDGDWWDDVGLWEPSKKRFPSGFQNLLNEIKNAGLIPGLWVEPEVVGVRSVVADQLPKDAFFYDHGKRVVEKGRYQLDYRHPKVIEWMDSVVDRLVGYGAGYFKFDYNIEVMTGSDIATFSTGAAHLEHQRAYLSWVHRLLERNPGLVIENCSSGAQRMEYGMLSVHPLQSTSDQQDPLLYAAISAAIPTAVIPEQSASWAYPQAEWSDEINALTVVNSLLGRVHLSGRLDQLNASQSDLIREGMSVYKSIRHDIKESLPFWPLGLPKWHDDWISLGLVSKAQVIYLAIWRRSGSLQNNITLPKLRNRHSVKVDLLYPRNLPTSYSWQANTSSIELELPDTPCARLFRVSSSA